MMKHKKGQGTLEYIILITVIIVVLLVALGVNGPLRVAIDSLFGRTADRVDRASNLLEPAP